MPLLMIESPAAIQRALLKEWSGVAGGTTLVNELRAERGHAAGQARASEPAGGAVHGRGRADRDIFARDRRRVLSLADRCCLATATRLGLPAVADDRAWSTLDLGVRVVSFR